MLRLSLSTNSTVYFFSSKYGNLSIAKKSGVYTLELPSWKGETCAVPSEISDLTVDAIAAFSTRDLVLVLPSIESVRSFKPDDMRFKQLSNYHALIVTAANGENGYVLRYFAPKIGISEDLATGSAQCSLAPYWFENLTQIHFRYINFRHQVAILA